MTEDSAFQKLEVMPLEVADLLYFIVVLAPEWFEYT